MEIWSGDPRVKPPLGAAEIAWGRPLTVGLDSFWPMTEGAGPTTEDLTKRNTPATVQGTAGWDKGPGGRATNYPGVAGSYFLSPVTKAYGNLTVLVRFQQSGTPTNYERLVDKTFNTGFWLGRDSTLANQWGGGFRVGGGQFGVFVTLADGLVHQLALTHVAGGTAFTVYGDGAAVRSSGTADDTADTNSTTAIRFGEADVGSGTFRGLIYHVALWSRVLTADELWNLYVTPYAVLRPIIPRRYFVSAGGVVVPPLRTLLGVGR